MIRSIYDDSPNEWSIIIRKGKARGRPWFDIAKNSSFFFQFLDFKAQNGVKIRFCFDKWIGDDTLQASFPDIYNTSLKKEVSIADCWHENSRDWDLGLCRGLFDREMESWVGLIPLLDVVRLGEGDDKVYWSLGKGGAFATEDPPLIEDISYCSRLEF